MKDKETIEVFIDTERGKTVCICKRSRKRCRKKCQPDVVERDRFLGWESTMSRNRAAVRRGAMKSLPKSRDAPARATGPPMELKSEERSEKL